MLLWYYFKRLTNATLQLLVALRLPLVADFQGAFTQFGAALNVFRLHLGLSEGGFSPLLAIIVVSGVLAEKKKKKKSKRKKNDLSPSIAMMFRDCLLPLLPLKLRLVLLSLTSLPIAIFAVPCIASALTPYWHILYCLLAGVRFLGTFPARQVIVESANSALLLRALK